MRVLFRWGPSANVARALISGAPLRKITTDPSFCSQAAIHCGCGRKGQPRRAVFFCQRPAWHAGCYPWRTFSGTVIPSPNSIRVDCQNGSPAKGSHHNGCIGTTERGRMHETPAGAHGRRSNPFSPLLNISSGTPTGPTGSVLIEMRCKPQEKQRRGKANRFRRRRPRATVGRRQ